MKIVIAPDSYKGSLTAMEVCNVAKKALSLELSDAQVDLIPMADGGEGTLDTLLYATNGRRVELKATGPLGHEISSAYGVLGDGKTVVIEMAMVAGLPMIPDGQRNPFNTTTYGVGELLKHALDQGYRHFIVGLGGSATNDGGFGMLQALGGVFLDAQGQPVEPYGKNVRHIHSVDLRKLDERIFQSQIQVASDVENPLCGENGASVIFGPQKGATQAQIRELDEALSKYAALVEHDLNQSFQYAKGAGAAGGMGFALLALGAELHSGAKIVANATSLEERIRTADWVFTGEGQSDDQTLMGKVPFFVARLANQYHVKTILVSGGLGKGSEKLFDLFTSCHSISPGPVSLEDSIQNAEAYLFDTVRSIGRLIHAASRRD